MREVGGWVVGGLQGGAPARGGGRGRGEAWTVRSMRACGGRCVANERFVDGGVCTRSCGGALSVPCCS